MIIFYSYGYNVFSKKIKNIVEAKLTKINENNINIYSKKENKNKKSNVFEDTKKIESKSNINKNSSKNEKGNISKKKNKNKTR